MGQFLQAAIEEARRGRREGGIPISEVNGVLTAMTGFQTHGFHVIDNWRAAVN